MGGLLGSIGAASPAASECPSTPQALVDQGSLDEITPGPSGSLVTFDHESGRGCRLVEEGGEVGVRELSGPAGPSLAISPGGRRAYLVRDGRVVAVRGPDGGTPRELDRAGEIGALVWLDDRRLAVSPTNGEHRVEVFDVDSAQLLQAIGPTEAIPESPGYRVLRATALAWDAERRRLHTLDAYTGAYRVYELPGALAGGEARLVGEAQVKDLHRARYEEQTGAIDRQLAERGEYQGVTIWRFSLGLDPDGTAWTVERCEPGGAGGGEETSTAHLLAIDADGAARRHSIGARCCSLTAIPWQERIVLVGNGRPDRPGCFAAIPRPGGVRPEETTWIEVTPLSSGSNRLAGADAPASLLYRTAGGAYRSAGGAEVAGKLAKAVDKGLALVCVGGSDRALDCRQLWLDPERPGGLEEGALAPEPTKGREVSGRVTIDGRGAAGATVSLVPAEFRTTRRVTLPLDLPAGAERPVREVVSRADGRFLLPALAAGEYRLLLTLPGGRMDRTTTFTVEVPTAGRRGEPEAPLDLGVLDFPQGLELEVVVSGPDGRPIPGAEAGAAQELSSLAAAPEDPREIALFLTPAGDDGRALLEGLVPDAPVVVTCLAPGHAPSRERFEVVPASVPCVLDPLARVEGRVVDEDGEAVAAARLALGADADMGRGGGGATVTDDEGRFRFENLEAGRYRLSAAKPGLSAAYRTFALAPGDERDEGDVTLGTAARWRYRIVSRIAGTEDEPIPGAVLTAEAPSDSMAPATTDTLGEVEVEGPPDGPLTLEVRADGFAPRTVEVPEAARSLDREPSVLALEPAGWVEAHVWDGTGEPCVGCGVALSGPGPVQGIVTDGSGSSRSQPLAPGLWRASLTRLQSYGAVVTRNGGDDVRTVRVAPGAVAEVRFGDPAETMEVVLSPPPPPAAPWRLTVRDGTASRTYPIDADGSARVRRPRGSARLSLLGPGASVEIGSLSEGAADPAVVDLGRGLLTVRVPLEALDVAGHFALVDLATGRRAAEVELLPGGEVQVPFLPAGSYALRAGDAVVATAVVVDGRETVVSTFDSPPGR